MANTEKKTSTAPESDTDAGSNFTPSSAPKSTPASTEDSRGFKGQHSSRAELCFVISPFGGWHDAYYEEIYQPAIAAAGLQARRADSLFRSSNIVHDIWRLVINARIMVADLTGKNPNVFYELGLAHAARKPVLLLTQDIEDVPFDLRALRVIRYDTQHPKWGELLTIRIEKGLRETLASPETAVLPTFLYEEPDQQPSVTADEKRLLGLEQQLSSLRAEVRSTSTMLGTEIQPSGRPPRTGQAIDRADADRLLRTLMSEGVSRHAIRQVLMSEGAPEYWVDNHLDDAERQYNSGKKVNSQLPLQQEESRRRGTS